jgi:SAM-dependent methyltransferase
MSKQSEPSRLDAIAETYATHPLNAASILARARDHTGPHHRVTLDDLSFDARTGITDQNHVGGVEATLSLARLAAVSAESHVWDIGGGIGGSARWLAHQFGCKVSLVELSTHRARDARLLNELVGLSALVTVTEADALTVEPPSRGVDVLWGQAAWAHFDDKAAFLARWAPALGDTGRIAFEEPCLRQPAKGERAAKSLLLLEETWLSRLEAEEVWLAAVRDNGFRIVHQEERSADLVRFLEASLAPPLVTNIYPPHEVPGWSAAYDLASTGILGYLRVVAQRA